MTPTQALKGARDIVGTIHYFGGAYTFNILDREAGALREGPRYADKGKAGSERRRAMVREALFLMGVESAGWAVEMSPACDEIPRGGELAALATLYREAMA